MYGSYSICACLIALENNTYSYVHIPYVGKIWWGKILANRLT